MKFRLNRSSERLEYGCCVHRMYQDALYFNQKFGDCTKLSRMDYGALFTPLSPSYSSFGIEAYKNSSIGLLGSINKTA